MKFRLHLVGGARPNFMKIGPLYHALKDEPWCDVRIIHTGQHYDREMSDGFFEDLNLPKPHRSLGVGSGSATEQIARIMLAYDPVCAEEKPDLVVVVGDVNSTLACALTAKKQGRKVAHLEAGLRSRDLTMPEELNRILTDQLADLLWTPSLDADENLRQEGIPASRIQRVGNIMIDSFEMLRERIAKEPLPNSIRDLKSPSGFGVVTLHRPANVDDEGRLREILTKFAQLSETLPLVFPVHPRTRKNLVEFGLWSELESNRGFHLLPPASYIAFMRLVSEAKLVVTDSGGIQEETSYLGIPCLTLRDNTERPITITEGTNRLVKPAELCEVALACLDHRNFPTKPISLWDGKTALRIRDLLRAGQ